MESVKNPNRPTTVWEAIWTELNFLTGSRPPIALPEDDPDFETLVADFVHSEKAFKEYARTHREELKRTHSGAGKAKKSAGEADRKKIEHSHFAIAKRKQELEDQVRKAQLRVANYVYSRSHSSQPSALCLSGGGIRSATFSLGILEGLAQLHGPQVEGQERTLLHEFDYLSTVSGGGYIGGWFSSWVHRQSLPAVVHALQHGRGDKLDPDAAPVSFLREYSNYLNPKLGLTSADTWALVATVIRNILLNWLVLLPLIASVLILPVVLKAVICWLNYSNPSYAEPLGFFAELCALVAFCYMCVSVPAAEIDNPPQARFLVFGLAPAFLAAVLFTMLASVQRQFLQDGWQHPWWCGIPILVAFAWIVWYGYKRRRGLDPSWISGGILAVLLSAAVFAWFTSSAVMTLPTTWTDRSLTVFVALSVPAVLLLIFAGIAILVGVSSFDIGFMQDLIDDEDREWFARAGGWILIVAFGWLLLAGVGVFGGEVFTLIYTAVASTVSGWVLALLGRDSKTPANQPNIDLSKLPQSAKVRAWAVKLLLPAFVLLLLIALAAANQLLLKPTGWVGRHFDASSRSEAILAALCLFLIEFGISGLAAFVVNVNKFSLHGMYKLRLIRAYLGASRPDRRPNYFTGFDRDDNLNLRDLRQRPIPVVNMALNLVSGKRLSWQQRKAASFAATPFYSGSLWWGYRPTEFYSDRKNGFTLGGAVTISGAAASPNMGYHSSPLLTIVMTLFNARLGAWMGNTGIGGETTWQKNGPTFGWRSYIDELFGLTDADNNWIYLSDGGHFENLGIYEMVLRRCHTIVAIDAGCDKDYTFEDLANAVRKIRIDLGVPVEFPNGVQIGGSEKPTYHWAVGRIRYSQIDGTKEEHDGWLLYIKASMTGDEPADVRQYQRSSPDFPHESTTDQWFSESQFESYRALGQHIISSITGSSSVASLGEFVKRAERQITPCAQESMMGSILF